MIISSSNMEKTNIRVIHTNYKHRRSFNLLEFCFMFVFFTVIFFFFLKSHLLHSLVLVLVALIFNKIYRINVHKSSVNINIDQLLFVLLWMKTSVWQQTTMAFSEACLSWFYLKIFVLMFFVFEWTNSGHLNVNKKKQNKCVIIILIFLWKNA